jgi:hypothetical protein
MSHETKKDIDGMSLGPGMVVLESVHRHTKSEYFNAIRALLDAMTQLEPDGRPCTVCGDSGHLAWECHHNPLAVMHACEMHNWRHDPRERKP